ncbi:MAG: hypothetical protein HUJ31_11400, partial [Pseudomonadales bacterium]|nr:hypothetical protein [Pseudomonadales bacterium]
MELSAEARTILERAYRFNDATAADREEVETLVKRMPEDKVLLYKNVESNPVGDLPRYSIHIRIQHMIIFVTFLALAFTGLPIKYFDSFWADGLNQIVGGVDISRIVHRTLALAMIFGMLYHMVSITFGVVVSWMRGRFEVERTVIPVWKDISDFREDLLYFSGKRDQRPEMDKF